MNTNIKNMFSEAVDANEINEEIIFMIKEKLFESQSSKNLKGFNCSNNPMDSSSLDIEELKKFIEKIYKEQPIRKITQDFSKTLVENCLIVRNLSDHVDEEILFYLFSQGFFFPLKI